MRIKLFTFLLAGFLLAFTINGQSQSKNILIEKGLAYLASTQSTTKGIGDISGPSIDPAAIPILNTKTPGDWGGGGITSLCLQAFLQNGHNIDDPLYGTQVQNAIDYLLGIQVTSGYHIGSIGSWQTGYETAMAIVSLKLALTTPLSVPGSGYITDPLKTQIEDALDLALNYYLQDVNAGWSAVSWRYNRSYTSEWSGDMSVNQWVYLALHSMDYEGLDIWNKIYNYLNGKKCTSGNYAYIGYQSCGTWPQGNSCAGTWGAKLAQSTVPAAGPLAEQFYNYLETKTLSQLIDTWNIGDGQVYFGGGYYYYLYGFAKSMSLGFKTIFSGGDWYLYLYNAIESQHGVDGSGNYYWDAWGGQGYNMETALALLCLQTEVLPEGSMLSISLDTDVGKNDCIEFMIFDEIGNDAGNVGGWYTNIPNSEWVSTTGVYDLHIDLEESANYSVEITNICPAPQDLELCYRAYIQEELVDEECFLITAEEDRTIGATGFVNAIGGLNVIIIYPPVVIPVMELNPSVISYNPFEYNQTYNFEFDVVETGGESALEDIDLFASDLVDQFGNVIPAGNFTLTPDHIAEVPAGGFVTVQGTLVTPGSFNKTDPGLFMGNITAQAPDQAKAVHFEIGQPDLLVNPDFIVVPYTAGSGIFDIDITGFAGVAWTIDPIVGAWLTADPMAGFGDATVNFFYDANPNISERTGTITVLAPDALNDQATVTITQEASADTSDQVISLQAGWLGISGYIIPAEPAMETVLAGIAGSMEIILSKGGFYWPSQNINLIGDWNTYEGYKIKMNEAAALGLNGIPAAHSVTLPAGLSYLPVLSEVPVSNDVLAALGDNLRYAFNIQEGLVYWPAGGLATIDVLEPGIGYLTVMNNEATVVFPDKGCNPGTNNQVFINTTPWNDVINTGTAHIISIEKSALEILETGDVIGAFNAEGLCVGMTEFSGEPGNLALIVNGDDFTTQTIEGLLENENIIYKLYRPSLDIVTNLEVTYNPEMNYGQFTPAGLSMITNLKLGPLGIGQADNVIFDIYPNPSFGIFNIYVSNNQNIVKLDVVNTQGQNVYSTTLEGKTITTLDLSQLGQGIYFIRMITDNNIKVEKILIK